MACKGAIIACMASVVAGGLMRVTEIVTVYVVVPR